MWGHTQHTLASPREKRDVHQFSATSRDSKITVRSGMLRVSSGEDTSMCGTLFRGECVGSRSLLALSAPYSHAPLQLAAGATADTGCL